MGKELRFSLRVQPSNRWMETICLSEFIFTSPCHLIFVEEQRSRGNRKMEASFPETGNFSEAEASEPKKAAQAEL
jgi:hypothetical protein